MQKRDEIIEYFENGEYEYICSFRNKKGVPSRNIYTLDYKDTFFIIYYSNIRKQVGVLRSPKQFKNDYGLNIDMNCKERKEFVIPINIGIQKIKYDFEVWGADKIRSFFKTKIRSSKIKKLLSS